MSRCQFFKEYSLRNRRPSKNEDRVVMKIAFKKRVLNVGTMYYMYFLKKNMKPEWGSKR